MTEFCRCQLLRRVNIQILESFWNVLISSVDLQIDSNYNSMCLKSMVSCMTRSAGRMGNVRTGRRDVRFGGMVPACPVRCCPDWGVGNRCNGSTEHTASSLNIQCAQINVWGCRLPKNMGSYGQDTNFTIKAKVRLLSLNLRQQSGIIRKLVSYETIIFE